MSNEEEESVVESRDICLEARKSSECVDENNWLEINLLMLTIFWLLYQRTTFL